MATANPDYKYYKQLAGTWKSLDGSFEAVLTDKTAITVRYGGGTLEGSYGVTATVPNMSPGLQGFLGLGMGMGMNGIPAGMQQDPDVDIVINMGDRSIRNGEKELYHIDYFRHVRSDMLHIDLTDPATGVKTGLTLLREQPVQPLPADGEFKCECGYIGPVSRFCPECGALSPFYKPAPAPAPEPAQPVSTPYGTLAFPGTAPAPEKEPENTAGWTCTKCGAALQTGDTCAECGEPIKKELLFHLSEYKSTNPPQYDGASVWKFSDTKLIMRRGKRYRFISSDVIGPAMKIIKKYKIDEWEKHRDKMPWMCGGSMSVSYWDGKKMNGCSTDIMASVAGAYNELLTLFSASQ